MITNPFWLAQALGVYRGVLYRRNVNEFESQPSLSHSRTHTHTHTHTHTNSHSHTHTHSRANTHSHIHTHSLMHALTHTSSIVTICDNYSNHPEHPSKHKCILSTAVQLACLGTHLFICFLIQKIVIISICAGEL